MTDSPPFFSHINEKFRTPARSNLLFMLIVGLLAAFVPARLAGDDQHRYTDGFHTGMRSRPRSAKDHAEHTPFI